MPRWRLAVLLVVVGIVGYIAWVTVSIYNYGDKTETVSADVAIVLGAAVYDDQPSPVLCERVNHAVWLYHEGRVDKLIFTGGRSQEDSLSEAAAARQLAIDQQVPPQDIYIEERSRITEENLSGAARLMSEHHLSSAIVVSDPLHMRRAMRIGQDLGLDVHTSPTPTTRYVSWSSKAPFLGREVFFYIGYDVKTLFT